MRQQEFADPVIAYVLHEWRGLKNKTQLGRLLGPGGKVDSTYLSLANRLLEEAKNLNIQSA
jgi:ABC-type phosphate transport system ATPase subunit